MKSRLAELIQYKTDGRQNRFAILMGWTPQYLAKLLRGDNFGLQPVLTILEKLPEINARWFLFGSGPMLDDNNKIRDLEIRLQALDDKVEDAISRSMLTPPPPQSNQS